VIQSHRGDKPVRYHNFMARRGNWKLLNASGFGRETLAGKPAFELYDLASDPLELKNLATEKPEVLASLRKDYDAWFDDVGSTRPDNYAPQRIIVGTKHEPLTTLTRQDWRHTSGRPWQRNSRGHWLLNAPAKKTFDVKCRFNANPAEAAQVVLLVNGKPAAKNLIPPQTAATEFPTVALPNGDFRVEVVIKEGKAERGVHQVDLVVRK